MFFYQHGDVLVQKIDAIPVKAKKTRQRVLAEGATGHAHRLLEDADVEVYEHEGTLFLCVGPKGAQISHEEHGRGVIEQGEYRVGRVQEFDHFAAEARDVRD